MCEYILGEKVSGTFKNMKTSTNPQGDVNGLYNAGSGLACSTGGVISSTTLQNISYTYDANGNITQISDMGSTTASRTVAYEYDDLNRLTLASTTAASSTPYRQSYSYDILGSITGLAISGATSTYTYANTGYANPHSVTSLAVTTYTYYKSGNVTSAGTKAFSWNYRDRLMQVATGTASTTYAYDNQNQRVRQTVLGVSTTTYAGKNFDKVATSTQATTTSYIFSGDILVATVVGNGTATTTHYVHPAHLGSTNVVTSASGTVVQTLEYYPYGSIRINVSSDSSSASRQFIAQYADLISALNYLNARYYNAASGQFISQDPMFVTLSADAYELLKDPQQLNSYSYARNNPISMSDPTGLLTQREQQIIQLQIQVIYLQVALINVYLGTAAAGSAFLDPIQGYQDATNKSGNVSTPEQIGANIGTSAAIATLLPAIRAGVASILKRSTQSVTDAAVASGRATNMSGTVHGNSLSYEGESYGYVLVNKSTKEIVKFGETIHPETRYPKAFLNQNNLELQVISAGSKAETHAWQHSMITEWYKDFGTLPAINKSFW